MALKFSRAFGAKTIQFTTSPGKIDDAKRLGADEVILTRDTEWHLPHAGRFEGPTGPNSNTFAHKCATAAGFNANEPPRAYGW